VVGLAGLHLSAGLFFLGDTMTEEEKVRIAQGIGASIMDKLCHTLPNHLLTSKEFQAISQLLCFGSLHSALDQMKRHGLGHNPAVKEIMYELDEAIIELEERFKNPHIDEPKRTEPLPPITFLNDLKDL